MARGANATQLEFEQEATWLVIAGQSAAAVAETLGVVSQTLFNRFKAERHGKPEEVDTKFASAEQKEISRLLAKLACMNSDRNLRYLRLAAYVRRAAGSRLPAEPKVNPEADAAAWHSDLGLHRT